MGDVSKRSLSLVLKYDPFQLALISYGTGNVASYLVTPLRTKACAQLDAIQRGFESLGSDNVTLYSTIQSVNQFYGSTVDNMVLFTASK